MDLREARVRVGMSQQVLSDITKIPQWRLSRLETGQAIPNAREKTVLQRALATNKLTFKGVTMKEQMKVPKMPKPKWKINHRGEVVPDYTHLDEESAEEKNKRDRLHTQETGKKGVPAPPLPKWTEQGKPDYSQLEE